MNRNLSGIQFKHVKTREMHIIRAHDAATGAEVGSMKWLRGYSVLDPAREPGEILNLDVLPEYQRRGIATEMYHRGKRCSPPPRHSPERTPEGTGWAKSVGGYVPPLDPAWDV